MGGMTKPTEMERKHPDALIVYGPVLLIAGLLMTSGPVYAGLLVGGLGIAMISVWLMRHYR
jgi:hypothetical protein